MVTTNSLAASVPTLSLDSILQELELHDSQIDAERSGSEVAQVFEENPLLPGVILIEQDELAGVLSRRKFLEQMSRPYGLELFSRRPLKILYGFAQSEVLVLPGHTSIVTAAREALQRSPELLYEPIVVQLPSQEYRLLDVHQLLVAQSRIHELATQLLQAQTQAHLIQTEKMASLGRMIAGVAHEILNPVNFIWGNLSYLGNYSKDLIRLVRVYEQESSQIPPQAIATKAEIDFDFLARDLPQVIDSMKIGAERLKQIVSGLRSFSHIDETQCRPANLHECLDNTLLILNNRLKYGINVVKNYGDLPLVNCYSGQLSQVFVNLISNAIDALLETSDAQKADAQSSTKTLAALQFPGEQPQITITTTVCAPPINARSSQQWVSIQIADNGPGIHPDIQERIFETFFTTKPVGQGTGLGLAISHQIVTEKHQGQLQLRSQPGVGTEFEILLPIDPA